MSVATPYPDPKNMGSTFSLPNSTAGHASRAATSATRSRERSNWGNEVVDESDAKRTPSLARPCVFVNLTTARRLSIFLPKCSTPQVMEVVAQEEGGIGSALEPRPSSG
jgi:hypothetical protein